MKLLRYLLASLHSIKRPFDKRPFGAVRKFVAIGAKRIFDQ
jgi:hypothetical protein